MGLQAVLKVFFTHNLFWTANSSKREPGFEILYLILKMPLFTGWFFPSNTFLRYFGQQWLSSVLHWVFQFDTYCDQVYLPDSPRNSDSEKDSYLYVPYYPNWYLSLCVCIQRDNWIGFLPETCRNDRQKTQHPSNTGAMHKVLSLVHESKLSFRGN